MKEYSSRQTEWIILKKEYSKSIFNNRLGSGQWLNARVKACAHSVGRMPLHEKMWMVNYTTYVGNVQLEINDKNLKLKGFLKGSVTFLGLNGGNTPFKSIDAAFKWVEERYEAIAACKTMNKLIYVD